MKKLLIILLPVWLLASSLYLPLDNPLMNDVEKMAVIANMPTAKKPYSLKMIKIYNKKIEDSYPSLYKKIDDEISRLSGGFAKERMTAAFAVSDGDRAIPNSRGKDINSSYDFHAAFLLNPSDYIQASVDANGYEKDDEVKIATNNSYISFGWDYFQIDAGYRDHWFSAFKNGSMLFSTNAINSPSVTISNIEPFGFAKFNYELFVSKLEETDGIRYGDALYSGNPAILGMHFNFHIAEWLEIGLNRTFQFGGGKRSVGLKDVAYAIIDPVNKDNSGGSEFDSSDPNYEFGNQQASITFKMNAEIKETPLSLYYLYGGEDTASHDNTQLGNQIAGFGIYLPFLTKNSSLCYEFIERQSAWYIHHIYQNGYTNDGSVMGSWVGDTLNDGDRTGGNFHYLNLNHKLSEKSEIDIKTRVIEHENYSAFDYERGLEASVEYAKEYEKFNYKAQIYGGNTTFGEDFLYLGLRIGI